MLKGPLVPDLCFRPTHASAVRPRSLCLDDSCVRAGFVPIYSAWMAQRAMERAVSMYSSLFSNEVGAPQPLKTSAFHSGVRIDMSALEKMPRQTVLR